MTLMDWYSGSYNLMFVALAEIVCIMYVYGELTLRTTCLRSPSMAFTPFLAKESVLLVKFSSV